jgi:predicted nucleic acid-binding protein
LDSWAVLAWLDGDEPAAEVVQRALDQERPAMSWINLVEVDYRVRRQHGAAEADTTISLVRELVVEELPGVSRMRAAAALKAEHPIALAECFAIATATANGAMLITGDPEIIDRAEQLSCAITDARVTPDPGDTPDTGDAPDQGDTPHPGDTPDQQDARGRAARGKAQKTTRSPRR